jgi:hypothetical protein
VRVLPDTEQEKRQAAKDLADHTERAGTDAWLIGIGLAQSLVFLLQLFAFLAQKRAMDKQEKRLSETISEMRRIAAAQSADTQTALGHAKTSADAATVSADATKASVEAMDEIAEKQLRGYLLPYDGSIVVPQNPPNAGLTPSIRMAFKNCGQTPVKNVRFHMQLELADRPLSAPLPTLIFPPYFSQVMIGPQGTVYQTFRGTAINTASQAALARGTHVLYLQGEIRYTDAFEKERRTRYRFLVNPHLELEACEEGNDWD